MRDFISENTSISLGLLGAIVGGVFWFTSLYALANQTASEVKELRAQIQAIHQIGQDVAVIKQMLKKSRE